MKKMNKYIIIPILLIMFSLITGCNVSGGNSDDSPNNSTQNPSYNSSVIYDSSDFIQVARFTYNEDLYEVGRLMNFSLLKDLNKDVPNIIYSIEEYLIDEITGVNNWTINYKQDVTKILCEELLEKAFVDVIYENIKTSLKEISLKLELQLDYYYDLYNIEKEIAVDLTTEFDKIYVVDLYFPYLLQNKVTNQTYILNIPVKSILAYKNQQILKFVVDKEIIEVDYNTFITSCYVIK